MNINQERDVEMEETEVSARYHCRKTDLDDPFFYRLFSKTRLPIMKFKQDPRDLFFFLKDLASNYVSMIQRVASNQTFSGTL